MDKFDRYFKGASKNMYPRIVNTYVDYLTNYNHHYLYTNGYSVVMCDTCNTRFTENLKLKASVIDFFESFIDKTNIESIITYDYDYVKNNSIKNGRDMIFKFNNDYSMDIKQLNKIKGMIGCNKINYIVKKDSYHPIIEIVGRGMQVGYLLPMKSY